MRDFQEDVPAGGQTSQADVSDAPPSAAPPTEMMDTDPVVAPGSQEGVDPPVDTMMMVHVDSRESHFERSFIVFV